MSDYIIDVDFWEAHWGCPDYKELTCDSDDGVEDEGDIFNVICRECDYEYIVNKG